MNVEPQFRAPVIVVSPFISQSPVYDTKLVTAIRLRDDRDRGAGWQVHRAGIARRAADDPSCDQDGASARLGNRQGERPACEWDGAFEPGTAGSACVMVKRPDDGQSPV